MPTSAPPHIRAFRILSGAGILLGAGGILISSFFWVCAVSLCVGLSALALDLRYEFRQKKYQWIRRIAYVCILLILLLFTFGLAFYPDKLEFRSYSFEGLYELKEPFHGIPWESNYSDLRVYVNNPTKVDFEKLDFVINVDVSLIKDFKQITEVPINFLPKNHMIHINQVDEKTGKRVAEQEKPMEGYNELRITCEKLPKLSEIDIIMAVVSPTPELEYALRTGDFSKVPLDKGAMFNNFYIRKRVPFVRITGEYSRFNRPYEIAVSVDVKPR
jgi:hypothetical protein